MIDTFFDVILIIYFVKVFQCGHDASYVSLVFSSKRVSQRLFLIAAGPAVHLKKVGKLILCKCRHNCASRKCEQKFLVVTIHLNMVSVHSETPPPSMCSSFPSETPGRCCKSAGLFLLNRPEDLKKNSEFLLYREFVVVIF